MAIQPREDIAANLLGRAHSPDTAATIQRERVQQRPLLLRPSSPDPDRNARSKRQYERLQKEKAQRQKFKGKPKPLSARQKRKLCLFEIPKDQQKYEIYAPLHQLWCGYMREILGVEDAKKIYVDATTAGPLLVSADYHGALVEVVRSRCVSRVGLKGIVVKDNKFTFEICTSRNQVKNVPKEHTVFRFEVPFGENANAGNTDEARSEDQRAFVFEIHGNQFQSRAPDRANRKFRQHFDPDL